MYDTEQSCYLVVGIVKFFLLNARNFELIDEAFVFEVILFFFGFKCSDAVVELVNLLVEGSFLSLGTELGVFYFGLLISLC